ncbi:MAG TPA: alpha/beta hydrolase [Solirubrobacteraceae bacterium]|jgi:pimeloyl-ACP methyl ester carboxylesterase
MSARSRVALLAAALCAALAAPSAAAAERVVSVPVSFEVANVNGSRLACPSDGAKYTLRGRLIGPEGTLARGRGLATTLYLHEYSFGKFFWNLTQIPAFDYATQQAEQGHVSVVVDRLGYDDSDHPEGTMTCLGAHADMARQIVAQLRSGEYGGEQSPAFDKVVLAGHSVGAAAAELAAYSFADMKIDGLVIFAWADSGFSQRTVEQSFAQGGVCTTGGEQHEDGKASGYAYYGQTEEDFQKNVFNSAPPDVVALVTSMRNRDPCGDAASLTPATGVNSMHNGEIAVPILLLFGEKDSVFQPGAGETQRDSYTSSPEVTYQAFADAGHALVFESAAPQVREKVDAWLDSHGFVSAGAAVEDKPGAGPPSGQPNKPKPRPRKRSKRRRGGRYAAAARINYVRRPPRRR